jgi:hypothetical protein
MPISKLIAPERIARAIFVLRGQRVLLDAELAALYGVAPKFLLQSVNRNRKRFPVDFMIQLTAAEWNALRSQNLTLKPGRGQHRKYLPYAFTEGHAVFRDQQRQRDCGQHSDHARLRAIARDLGPR